MLNLVNLNLTGISSRVQKLLSPCELSSAQSTNSSSRNITHSAEPLVSVVIPCYNCGKYIEECVESVINQSYPNIEIIIVNDKSTDNSEQKIEELKKKYPDKIKVITNEKNQERSESRNKGIAVAKGEFICFLDADDKWDNSKILTQVNQMITDPALAFCGTGKKKIDSSSNALNEKVSPYIAYSGEIFFHLLEHNSSFCKGSIMVRKSIVDKVGGFNTRTIPSEDYEYWLKVAQEGRYLHIPEKLTSYRVHEEQSTHRKNINLKKYIKLHKQILNKFSSDTALDSYMQKVNARGGIISRAYYEIAPKTSIKSRIKILSQLKNSQIKQGKLNRKDLQSLKNQALSLSYLNLVHTCISIKDINKAKKYLIASLKLNPKRIFDPWWIYLFKSIYLQKN